ncbi:hypothetical protein ACGFR8_02120 [Streptomyces brevispora]|uniref:hypothetical protein n=1 Tax=Streptomyces brevispora TaxID=887462 RepID=UPI003711A26D
MAGPVSVKGRSTADRVEETAAVVVATTPAAAAGNDALGEGASDAIDGVHRAAGFAFLVATINE